MASMANVVSVASMASVDIKASVACVASMVSVAIMATMASMGIDYISLLQLIHTWTLCSNVVIVLCS